MPIVSLFLLSFVLLAPGQSLDPQTTDPQSTNPPSNPSGTQMQNPAGTQQHGTLTASTPAPQTDSSANQRDINEPAGRIIVEVERTG